MFYYILKPLSNILEKYDQGFILKHYKKEKRLTNEMRKIMSKSLLMYFLVNKIYIGRKELPKIVDLIMEEFPSENRNLYYGMPLSGKNPTGKLFNIYKYRYKLLRDAKLVPYKNSRKVESSVTSCKLCYI